MSSSLSTPTTILLTGGTSGIGLQLVRKLAAQGHNLIVIARRASTLSDSAGRIIPYDCDLVDEAALAKTLEAIIAEHPDITMVVNNAALQYACVLTAPDFDAARMRAEVAVNLLAPATIVQKLLPMLLAQERRCAIVNISSGLAFYPKTQTALYCATKAAIHSFSQSLRYQLEDSAINVIEVILPLVDTPMTEGRGRGKLPAGRAADAIIAGIERGRSEIYVGKAKLIPALLRIAPSVLRRSLKGSLRI
ncbi:MAG: SDR family NAD(P)-dependent oxidoreductase [Hyphomonadaceae bacterium]|nr:SDR family NAD(P)-dependent oxidoreductase [Hyphomonadaceae bacterium]